MSRPLDDLPTLRAFRDALTAVAVREATARGRRRPRRPVGVALAALAALALGGSAAAATLVGLRGTVIPGPSRADVAPEETVVAGSARLLAVRAADPADGSTWTLRAARSRGGEQCLTVGQLRRGTFGLVGLDGRFRALATSIVDGCSAPAANDVALLGARVFDAQRRADVRTVIYGLAGATLRSVAVTVAGATARRVPITREGAFAAVVAGYPEDRPLRVVARFADGHRVVRTFGGSVALVTGGRLPALKLEGFFVDSAVHTACLAVGAARTVAGAGHGPAICGSAKRPYAAVRAVRPGRHGSGATGYDWGTFPARTLVYGAWPRGPGSGLRDVIVRGPTGSVHARILGRLSFLAVLPAAARPADVRVTVVPRTGPPVTFRRSLHLVPHPLSR